MVQMDSYISHFNPLPPHGGRPQTSDQQRTVTRYFNPLPPHGGRPVFPDRIINHFHFNPLPPHGGRRLHKRTVRGILSISIHSLRMEGDSNLTLIFQFLVLFQSTPSAGRETDVPERVELPHPAFQSTPSAWRETTKTSNKPCRYEFQSTPSAWRETPA